MQKQNNNQNRIKIRIQTFQRKIINGKYKKRKKLMKIAYKYKTNAKLSKSTQIFQLRNLPIHGGVNLNTVSPLHFTNILTHIQYCNYYICSVIVRQSS